MFESATVFTLGNPTNMILGCGIGVWPLFKVPISWLTMEVYGAIQVLPGSSCSTQLWSLGWAFSYEYCCILCKLKLWEIHTSPSDYMYCLFLGTCHKSPFSPHSFYPSILPPFHHRCLAFSDPDKMPQSMCAVLRPANLTTLAALLTPSTSSPTPPSLCQPSDTSVNQRVRQGGSTASS